MMSSNQPAQPRGDRPLWERFPALARLRAAGRQRIPEVLQMLPTECSAACLTMILGYHGCHKSLEEVREVLGPDRDGATMRSLLNAARRLGLNGRGVQVSAEDLRFLSPGAILHWEFRHYVVFERLRHDEIELIDPALGRRRIPLEQVRRSFTGVALLLEPGDGFIRNAAPSSRLWRTLQTLLGKADRLPQLLVTSALLQLFALGLPVVTGLLLDKVVPRGDWGLLGIIVVGSGGLLVFNFLALLLRSQLLLYLRTCMDAQLTIGFCDHLVDLPYAFFQRHTAGDLLMRLNSNATVRELLTSGTLSSFIDGALVIVYLSLVVLMDARMALLLCLLGILQITVFMLSRGKQRRLLARDLDAQVRARSYEVELLGGMETLKAMGCERSGLERWSALFVEVLNVNLERGRLSALTDALSGTLRTLSPLAILGYGTMAVLNGRLSVGSMMALNALGTGILTPLGGLVLTLGQLQLVGMYSERIDDVLHSSPEQDVQRVRPCGQLKGQIELREVSFRYGPTAPLVLKDISLKIEPGQFVAVVGTSGSGKSTLASLIIGLYRPSGGRILYDGQEQTELDLRTVRQQIGIVPQHVSLFSGSIRSNIALADASRPLELVMQAAKRACIHDEITAMPMQYETLLMDRGAALSGGQRQRIALARAVYCQPAILLLDESTSALDARTERAVQEQLAAMRCTRIVIAHRLSTVMEADQILVVEDGQIIERGTHAELLSQGQRYNQLIAAQMSGT